MGERHERLSEAIDIIQGLLAGHLPNYRGKYFQLDHANLFDRPAPKPLVAVAAGGPKAAALAGRKADALIATEPRTDLVEAYVSGGGAGPRYAEVALCCAERQDEAVKTAHRYFRRALSGWPVMAELPDTSAFAAASNHVSPDAVEQAVSCGPSPDRHLSAIGRYIEAGYDHIILLQVGPDQDYFFDLFERELAQALHLKAAA